MWRYIDVEHLAEELEDMGKREKHALRSRTVVLLAHLLKYIYQPEYRSPNLKLCLIEELEGSYISAKMLAARETGLSEAEFPLDCPFTLKQLLDEHFWLGT